MSQPDSNPKLNPDSSLDSNTSSVLKTEGDQNETNENVNIISNESIKSINRRRRVTISESKVTDSMVERLTSNRNMKRVEFDLDGSVNNILSERKPDMNKKIKVMIFLVKDL